MQKYSPEILTEVTRLAALFFVPREIAMMLELPEEFIDDCSCETNEAFRAYQGGRLQSEVDLRAAIMKMAKAGSSPAQTMSLEILKQSKAKMFDR